jgi:erythromycin esterase-like protein
VAWEEDWTTGLEVDDYLHGGPQDLARLVATMSPQYRTGEVADVLAWLRGYNAEHRDQVSFVGVEYYFTRSIAYDVVDRYVAAVAPHRLAELRRHLEPLRPTSDDPFAHIDCYSRVPDKQPYLDHAHAVHDLVSRLRHRPADRQQSMALHAATQIVSFYEHYAMPEAENAVYREARAAESLQWSQDSSGDRVAYWAASAHTANATDLRIVRPGATDLRFTSTGAHLHRRYGAHYLSIVFTADHGRAAGDPGHPVEVVPPSPDWFEAPLGAVPHATFAPDLRARHAPLAVHGWLHDPITMRGLPQAGAGSVIDGGTAARWFDVIVHTQEVRPARDG